MMKLNIVVKVLFVEYLKAQFWGQHCLYINDICNVSTLLKYFLFAGDTNLLYEHENYETLFMDVNNELPKLNLWFSITSNKLSLNVLENKFYVVWK